MSILSTGTRHALIRAAVNVESTACCLPFHKFSESYYSNTYNTLLYFIGIPTTTVCE